jgi:hypothetical protein
MSKSGAHKESFQNSAKFKDLGTTLTAENCIHDEIKGR